MDGDSRSIADVLAGIADDLGSPVADDATFHARLAAALASAARAASALLLRLEGDRLQPVGQLGRVDPGWLKTLTETSWRQGASTPASDLVFGASPGERRARVFPAGPHGSGETLATACAAGGEVLGAIAAFDPISGTFASADATALDAAAAAAGLLWRQREELLRLVAANAQETDRARTAAERAGELEAMKRRILNLAAHELRGPITVIRGYLEMLADGSIDERGLRRVLPILNGKAAQMDALVTQMLEVARLDEGRVELKWARVDLGAICRETVDVAGLLAPPGTSVFLERPPAAIWVRGDAQRLATIIANLVDNAIKYSPDGGLVTCRVGSADGQASVEVRDRGLGIAETDLPILFSRFGRVVTPENSHISGTGLGLHLSRELARMHGGDITVRSEVGQGSTFTLQLPLAAPEP